MSRKGPLPDPPSEKRLRGTYRKDRDSNKTELVLAVDNSDTPVPPAFMLDEGNPLAIIARSIWEELHPKVSAMGLRECDSNLFTRYCFLEADVRMMFSIGALPTMSKMNTLRQMEELLRIAGPKSRVTIKAQAAEKNPFSRNGKKS